jgi:CheY-like chemotaxis protein
MNQVRTASDVSAHVHLKCASADQAEIGFERNQHVEKPTYDEFVGYLRSSLHYLYDTVHLRRSPLIRLLGLSEEFDRGAALQRILTDAIYALKPADDEPPQSTAWRIHDTLSLQYIRQFDRHVIATQLGISERQLRREQRLALEALAQRLWQNLDLDHTLEPPLAAKQPVENTPRPEREKDEVLSDELVWLQSPSNEQRAPLGEILRSVHGLAQPLAQQWRVRLQINVEDGLEDIPLSQLATRHILLTILSVTIPQAGQGEVAVSAVYPGLGGVGIEFRIIGSRTGLPPVLDADDPGMKTARHLATFYGADLSVEWQDMGFAVSLKLSAAEQIPVLVIDDNAGWDEMLKRYAVGSRYHVTGTREPRMAHALAAKMQPAAIFLDVMMPEVDGWQVLSELRQEQATCHIPIVVCTVLPLERLALSLGVNAFLQKPVTQNQFLSTLDKLIIRSGWPSSSSLA